MLCRSCVCSFFSVWFWFVDECWRPYDVNASVVLQIYHYFWSSMALTYGPSFCRMLAQRIKSSCVDELIAADHAYLGNCQTEWVDKRPSLMNGKKYIFHFVSSAKKSIFSSAFSPFFFALKSSISIENWLQRAKIVNIFYSNINFSIRKVSDRWRIARYGIWLIFFHISVFHVRSMAAIEKAPMGKWRIETKNDVNLFVPFRFSAVTHSLTHSLSHSDITWCVLSRCSFECHTNSVYSSRKPYRC